MLTTVISPVRVVMVRSHSGARYSAQIKVETDDGAAAGRRLDSNRTAQRGDAPPQAGDAIAVRGCRGVEAAAIVGHAQPQLVPHAFEVHLYARSLRVLCD